MHGFVYTMKLRPNDRKVLNMEYKGNSTHARHMRRLRRQISADGKVLGITSADIKNSLMLLLRYGK